MAERRLRPIYRCTVCGLKMILDEGTVDGDVLPWHCPQPGGVYPKIPCSGVGTKQYEATGIPDEQVRKPGEPLTWPKILDEEEAFTPDPDLLLTKGQGDLFR